MQACVGLYPFANIRQADVGLTSRRLRALEQVFQHGARIVVRGLDHLDLVERIFGRVGVFNLLIDFKPERRNGGRGFCAFANRRRAARTEHGGERHHFPHPDWHPAKPKARRTQSHWHQ